MKRHQHWRRKFNHHRAICGRKLTREKQRLKPNLPQCKKCVETALDMGFTLTKVFPKPKHAELPAGEELFHVNFTSVSITKLKEPVS